MSQRSSSKRSSSTRKTSRKVRKCYNNLPPAMVCDRWVSVESLGTFVKEFSGLDLSVQAVRTTLLTKIMSISTDCPFEKYVRFPKDRGYFLLSECGLDIALNDLQLSVSYRDRSAEVALSDGRSVSTLSGNHRDKKDSLVAASKKMVEIAHIFSDKSKCYTRARFEKTYPWEKEVVIYSSEDEDSDDEDNDEDDGEDQSSTRGRGKFKGNVMDQELFNQFMMFMNNLDIDSGKGKSGGKSSGGGDQGTSSSGPVIGSSGSKAK